MIPATAERAGIIHVTKRSLLLVTGVRIRSPPSVDLGLFGGTYTRDLLGMLSVRRCVLPSSREVPADVERVETGCLGSERANKIPAQRRPVCGCSHGSRPVLGETEHGPYHTKIGQSPLSPATPLHPWGQGVAGEG